MDPSAYQQICEAIRDQVGRAILGQDDVVDEVLVAILARGHVLIEGVPGLGKTLLVRTLAQVLGCDTKRIQFTPDLMPSDVTGSSLFDPRDQIFKFQPGPVFTRLLLADEVNRAPAKTQSALLEAMQERCVTVDGVTHPLPQPFFVLATQNPIESQGTYPLPEAQLDRFLLKVDVGHPSAEAEKAILRQHARGFDAAALETAGLEAVLDADELVAMQAAVQQVEIHDAILDYITALVGRTRAHRSIELGASPRGSIALLAVARVKALMEGRDYVVPDDVKSLARPVLRHRVLLHPDAQFEGTDADACLDGILEAVPVPDVEPPRPA